MGNRKAEPDLRENTRAKELSICFFPRIETSSDAMLCARYARWTLAPLAAMSTITVVLRSDLKQDALWPAYCRPCTAVDALSAAKQADKILVWKSGAFWGAPSWLRRKAIICDPYASFAATDTLNAWVSETLGENTADTAPVAFTALREACHGAGRDVLLIGTAPSQSHLLKTNKSAFDNPLCIYMGTAIANETLTDLFPPDIIVAADGASQFSCLEPGLAFKVRVEEIMQNSECLLVVPASVAGLIKTHWPAALASRILRVPVAQPVPQPSQLHERWEVEPTGNILTTLALPLACSLSRCIHFAGITIQENEEEAQTVHWRQASSVHYSRQVADILVHEPGAVLPKANYRAQHFEKLHDMLRILQSADLELCDLQGEAIVPASKRTEGTVHKLSPLNRILLFGIQSLAKAQHFSLFLGIFLIMGMLSITMISLAIFNVNTVLLGLAISCVCAIVSGVFFLRLRMNRMISDMEGRLSRQQAAQFDNLSNRLKGLEDNTKNQSD